MYNRGLLLLESVCCVETMSGIQPPPAPPLPPSKPLVRGGLPPELLQPDEYTKKRIQKELQFRLVGAIETEDVDLVESLIKAGLNTNATIQLVKTPLTLALDQDPVSYHIIKLLIDADADPDLPDKTPQAVRPLLVAIQKNLREIFTLLVDVKAAILACDKCDNSTLHFCAQFGRLSMLNEILTICPNTDVNIQDNCGKTPFYRACEQRHFDLADRLVEKGALVNCRDNYGWSPLFRAAMFGHEDTVIYLLDQNADVHIQDIKGDTPLHVACRCMKPQNCRTDTATSFDFYFRTWKMPSPALKALVQSNVQTQFQLAKVLINAGADVNARNLNDESPLNTILQDDEGVIKYLVQAGAVIHTDRLSIQNITNNIPAEEIPELLQNSIDLQNWLLHKSAEQFTLRWTARSVIRRQLGFSKDIQAGIKVLPLPEALKKYLDVTLS